MDYDQYYSVRLESMSDWMTRNPLQRICDTCMEKAIPSLGQINFFKKQE
jgi:hypothetical protein